MTGGILKRRAAIIRLVVPLFAMLMTGWVIGAEEKKQSPGEAKFPGEKWKLVNVVNISGDALKFALGDAEGEGLTGGKIIIHEYCREESKAEPVEIMKFYRSKLKDPDAKPVIQVLSPEDCQAVEVYVTHLDKDDSSQFCLVSVDSSTVTVIEIVSQMVDEVLRSLGGSLESISDSIRQEMEVQRQEMEKLRKDIEDEKDKLREERKKLENGEMGLLLNREKLRERLEELEERREMMEKELEQELLGLNEMLKELNAI
jgi:hypothetical protein